MWYNYLFCGPRVAAQRAAQPRPDRRPESQCLSKGRLEFVDAFYDIRYSYNQKIPGFSISGFSGALPDNHPEHAGRAVGAVYGSGDGSFTTVNYAKETSGGANRSERPVFQHLRYSQPQLHFRRQPGSARAHGGGQDNGGSYALTLPGVYRVSVNPGGTVAIAFVQNSNFVYYTRKLSAAQTIAYSGGPTTWPKAAVDCEPQNAQVVPLPGAKPRSSGSTGIPMARRWSSIVP